MPVRNTTKKTSKSNCGMCTSTSANKLNSLQGVFPESVAFSSVELLGYEPIRHCIFLPVPLSSSMNLYTGKKDIHAHIKGISTQTEIPQGLKNYNQ